MGISISWRGCVHHGCSICTRETILGMPTPKASPRERPEVSGCQESLRQWSSVNRKPFLMSQSQDTPNTDSPQKWSVNQCLGFLSMPCPSGNPHTATSRRSGKGRPEWALLKNVLYLPSGLCSIHRMASSTPAILQLNPTSVERNCQGLGGGAISKALVLRFLEYPG